MKLFSVFLLLAGLAAAQSMNTVWTAQTAVGATAAFNVSLLAPHKHTVQWVTAGGPTTCTLRLEGSLDGSNWADLTGAQTCTSTGMFHVVDKPVMHVRVYLISLGGGAAPIVRCRYLGVR